MKDKEVIFNKCRQVFEYYQLKQEKSKGTKDNADQKKESNVDWNDF